MGENINKEYKDRLFKLVFNEKEDLLELYNAVNRTDYDNPDDLIINTLEDVIYMGMKNDLSFIIDDILNLYEHQSTFNPNIPLRGLFYITNIYKGIVGSNVDIYSSKIIELPLPKYVVFYNGLTEEPETMTLSIRDAFNSDRREDSCLEFKATLLNINLGNNKVIMEKCHKLKEYAQLIARIRDYQKQGYSIEKAMDMAVSSCIDDGILADILAKNRAEVMNLILTEYNEQNHIANEKQISKEEGLREGMEQGIESGIQILIESYREIGVSKEDTMKKVQTKYDLSNKSVTEYFSKYWK